MIVIAQSSDGVSWAAKTCPKKLDKNVMEIFLEKDEKGLFNASDNETARVLQKLGVDVASLACWNGPNMPFRKKCNSSDIEEWCQYG